MRPPPWLVVVLVGAALGLLFAGVSTYDFVQHLDRQVHSLHCSFIPVGTGHEGGTSGCQAAMMSTYSSVLRTRVWGGIPISLPAMAVFAFLMFYGLDILFTRRLSDRRATGFFSLAAALPAATSLVMMTISITKLGTACKLCIGIYFASALCLIGAVVLWRKAVYGGAVGESKGADAKLVAVDTEPATNGFLAGMFGVGVAFVAVPVIMYLVLAPDHSKFIGSCDGLVHPEDTYGTMVHVNQGGTGGAPALEILDPLCPACKAFEQRLDASGLADQLDRKAILFPLDSSCNWMITETTHPGACTVSEAVLCAGDKAPEVIAWAFEVQDQIREAAKTDPAAAARIVGKRFPQLASCIGSPDAKSRLNKSLRWAVSNNVRVLTPQLFVDNVKLCDEDVDLGLEYALSIMLDRHARGILAQSAPTPAPAAAKPIEREPETAPTGKPATDKPAGDKPEAPSDQGDHAVTAPDHGAEPAAGKPADKPVTAPEPAADKPPADRPADKPADKPPVVEPTGSQGGAP